VDLGQAGARGVVERGAAHLVEQLLDHRADPHHLRGLAHERDDVLRLVVVLRGVDDHHARLVVGRGVLRLVVGHQGILTDSGPGRSDRGSRPAR